MKMIIYYNRQPNKKSKRNKAEMSRKHLKK